MQKVLFLDRDGTLNLEPDDYQVDALEKVAFFPGVFQYLGRIAHELDFELVMVTNQDGLGTDSFPEEGFWPAQNLIVNTLKGEDIVPVAFDYIMRVGSGFLAAEPSVWIKPNP